MRLWDASTGRQIEVIGEGLGEVNGVAFGRRGLIASASGRLVRVWDTAGAHGAEVLRGHRGQVQSVAFDPRGRAW